MGSRCVYVDWQLHPLACHYLRSRRDYCFVHGSGSDRPYHFGQGPCGLCVDRRRCTGAGCGWLVDAFHWHAGVCAAYRRGLRRAPHAFVAIDCSIVLRVCPVAGYPAASARVATEPGRVIAGARHQHHALHRHGGHAHAARYRLRALAGVSFPADCDCSRCSGVMDSVPSSPATPQSVSGARVCGGVAGHGHRRHALHRHGGGELCRWQFLRCAGGRAEQQRAGPNRAGGQPVGAEYHAVLLHSRFPPRNAYGGARQFSGGSQS